jgi:cardiolipin synthase
MLLTTFYAAQRELIMTTPYFVPDEAMVTALLSAAYRGVDVTIVLPAKVNHVLIQLASHAILDELIEAGVRVAFFTEGLLHTKTVTIDDEIALIGSVNMDMRSFWLNFEVTLFVYDRAFTERLRRLQQAYYPKCEFVDRAAWQQRSFSRRLAENTALLLGPIL